MSEIKCQNCKDTGVAWGEYRGEGRVLGCHECDASERLMALLSMREREQFRETCETSNLDLCQRWAKRVFKQRGAK